MAKTYVQPGDVMEYTNASGAIISSGTVLKIGSRIGVVLVDIPDGKSGSVAVTGVWTIAKLGTDVVGQGDLLYWDDTNKRLTTTSTDNTLAGYAFKAAGSGVTTVEIKINA